MAELFTDDGNPASPEAIRRFEERNNAVPRVTVEEVRNEAGRWAEHMRKESVSDEWDETGKQQFAVVAEAYEEIVSFIDNGTTEKERSAFRMRVRRLKEAHRGRRH